MHTLTNDLRKLIALSLDGHSLCQLALCNRLWYETLQDEQLWSLLLSTHFQTLPLQSVSAKVSYAKLYAWPERSEKLSETIWNEINNSPIKVDGMIRCSFFKIFKGDGPIYRPESIWEK